MAENSGEKSKVSPPYTSFQSFKTLLGNLKEHGVPSRIDRSVLTNFSGAVGSQLITAFRFLKLINADNQPSEKLHGLVEALDTPSFKGELEGVIRNAYGPIFSIDLETATPGLFGEHFKKTFGGADAVISKCMTFFLNAAQEADILVSPRILSKTKPRAKTTKRKKPKTGSKGKGGKLKDDDSDDVPPPPPEKLPSQVVFDVFDPVNMPEDVQRAALTLITWFKSEGR